MDAVAMRLLEIGEAVKAPSREITSTETEVKGIGFEQPVRYSRQMIEVVSTGDFERWLRKLQDRQGKLRILERVNRVANGNP